MAESVHTLEFDFSKAPRTLLLPPLPSLMAPVIALPLAVPSRSSVSVLPAVAVPMTEVSEKLAEVGLNVVVPPAALERVVAPKERLAPPPLALVAVSWLKPIESVPNVAPPMLLTSIVESAVTAMLLPMLKLPVEIGLPLSEVTEIRNRLGGEL